MSIEATLEPKQCEKRFEYVAARIEQQRCIAQDTWRMTVVAPELARRALPGQFFMVRIAGLNDPLIGRALAMYQMHRDTNGHPHAISVVYTVKGKFTRTLSERVAGERVELWGPLGNAFSTQPTSHLILVAGGVGQTPMLSYAARALGKAAYGPQDASQPFASRVTLCYGARSQSYFAGVEDFQRICTNVRLATDDGSTGHHGLVTELLEQELAQSTDCRIACCGPEPMMESVSMIADRFQVPCEVSLETPMACGVGICFTCVAKIKQADGSWDYKRTCMEGPIFPSSEVVWR